MKLLVKCRETNVSPMVVMLMTMPFFELTTNCVSVQSSEHDIIFRSTKKKKKILLVNITIFSLLQDERDINPESTESLYAQNHSTLCSEPSKKQNKENKNAHF